MLNNIDNIDNIDNKNNIDKNNKHVKIPQKRGRKPKIKVESDIKKEPKKRGRKPKIKIISEEEKNKFVLPSKRGRKPKQQNVKKTYITDITNTILHLPIPLNIINNIDNNNNILNNVNQYENNSNILKSYESYESSYYSDFNKSKLYKNDIINIDNTDNNIDNIDTYNNIYNKKNYKELNNINNFYEENNTELNKNNNINNLFSDIKTNTDINSELHSDELDINSNYYNYVKTYNNIQKNIVKCNWCFHDCNEIYKLPYEINSDDIKYFGYFCCPECTIAFNFNEFNDEYVWERYSLINYLYNSNNTKLNIAPSRLLLNIFGGPLSIIEFRDIIKKQQYVNIIYPPQYIICPQIEIKKNTDNKLFVPLNINRVNKYTEDLKLKRNKPINNNTLDNCMKLTCI